MTSRLVAWSQGFDGQGVQPAAEELLGTRVARIEHFGAYSCRRIYGRDSGRWSEHATGNAIDVAAFVLADGRRVTVRGDWRGEHDQSGHGRSLQRSGPGRRHRR